MTTSKKTEGGTVLRGADGSLYFVRDEMLEALRVEGEGLDRMGKLLNDDKHKAESAKSPADGLERLRYVNGDLLKDQPADAALPDIGAVKSTIMCPWFC